MSAEIASTIMSPIISVPQVFDFDSYESMLEYSAVTGTERPSSATYRCKYDYILKYLIVGDNDVGKDEIMQSLVDEDDESSEVYRSRDVAYKSTSILLYGKRIKLHIWNTSGQGRFSTVFHTYSRGAQGIILVYDIANKWSFSGLDRWLREIDKYAPGLPKILVGNRKHLAFRRQISEKAAKNYAAKHNMAFLEVSPLCNFNIQETCAELSRLVLERNGMMWTSNSMSSLQELCYRKIVGLVNAYEIEHLPLPTCMKSYLKSFSSPVATNHTLQNHLDMLRKQKSKKHRFSLRHSLFTCDRQSDRSGVVTRRSPSSYHAQAATTTFTLNDAEQQANNLTFSTRHKRHSACTIS